MSSTFGIAIAFSTALGVTKILQLQNGAPSRLPRFPQSLEDKGLGEAVWLYFIAQSAIMLGFPPIDRKINCANLETEELSRLCSYRSCTFVRVYIQSKRHWKVKSILAGRGEESPQVPERPLVIHGVC